MDVSSFSSKQALSAEGDLSPESLQARLDDAAAEAATLAAELHEAEQAVAARDELLEEAREVAADSKDRLSRVRAEAEEGARREAEAESLAASEGGKRWQVLAGRLMVAGLSFFFVLFSVLGDPVA